MRKTCKTQIISTQKHLPCRREKNNTFKPERTYSLERYNFDLSPPERISRQTLQLLHIDMFKSGPSFIQMYPNSYHK